MQTYNLSAKKASFRDNKFKEQLVYSLLQTPPNTAQSTLLHPLATLLLP